MDLIFYDTKDLSDVNVDPVVKDYIDILSSLPPRTSCLTRLIPMVEAICLLYSYGERERLVPFNSTWACLSFTGYGAGFDDDDPPTKVIPAMAAINSTMVECNFDSGSQKSALPINTLVVSVCYVIITYGLAILFGRNNTSKTNAYYVEETNTYFKRKTVYLSLVEAINTRTLDLLELNTKEQATNTYISH